MTPSLAHGLLRTARPRQWLKNILVFAAPGAAGVLDDWPELGQTILAFVAFCLAASGVYFWNDALDVRADRIHPTKRFRPVAAGIVSIGLAKVTGTVLIVLGLGVAALTGRWETAGVIGVYVVVVHALQRLAQARRRRRHRHRGVRLRAAGGGRGGRRRRADVQLVHPRHGVRLAVHRHRQALRRAARDRRGLPPSASTLADYSIGYVRIVLTVSCGAALVSYCQWAFETRDLAGTEWPFYELSIVPMLTALLRYALVLEQGRGAAPEEVFASDRVLQLLGVAWVVVFGMAVYLR